MGFYTPATIVEDAKRHHVVVRSIDIQTSAWQCTLESCKESIGGFAVRMGLRYVKGLGEGEWERIGQARQSAPFASLDIVPRTSLMKVLSARWRKRVPSMLSASTGARRCGMFVAWRGRRKNRYRWRRENAPRALCR